MKLPIITGIIDRRVLINYRIDLAVLKNLLPAPFKPIPQQGYGVGGICLIRLKEIRPQFIPKYFGISSENAAHRFAVYWEESGQTKEGVFIPRRDTSLFLNSVIGGRIFPGVHHYSEFSVDEREGSYSISFKCQKDSTNLSIQARETSSFSEKSIFCDLKEVSNFFKTGSVGYSPSNKEKEFEGLKLITNEWKVSPLEVMNVNSSYLDDQSIFPEGSVEFDNAVLMKNIPHEWKSMGVLSSSKVT